LIKKIKIEFLVFKFFSILDHQTLNPDPGSGSAIRKNAGSGSVSGSALNQCGSETLNNPSDISGKDFYILQHSYSLTLSHNKNVCVTNMMPTSSL
jgi:hypothetical protein